MGMVDRREYLNQKKTELSFMVKTLHNIYGDDDRLNQSVKRYAILGSNISELKKYPDKVMAVFLPVILSYGEVRTGLARIYNGERSYFKNAVDALLENGVDEFYKELQKVQ